jgi:arsenate reductase-like glutaredoxin family protein
VFHHFRGGGPVRDNAVSFLTFAAHGESIGPLVDMASKLMDDFRAIVNSRSDRPKEFHTIVNKLKVLLDEKLSYVLW